MKNILLVDGDILAYTISSNSEQAIHWGDDLWTLSTDFKECKDKVNEYLKNISKNFNAKKVYIFLSDTNNFRKQIYPEYKLNRINRRKPTVLYELKRYLFEEHEAISEPRLEADDLMGIFATDPKIKGNKIIISIDKDLKTIPGQISKDLETVEKITKKKAQYNHAFQTLCGDASDNFPGCPGIGPVKAEKILDTKNLWKSVLNAFSKAKLNPDSALLQARLAYILQHGDYNFKTKKIRMWRPNGS
tara:strand:+ start:374 stop:1111 length:738 start_codon:yes stop_codon:yes gene_type:complete